MTTPLVDVAWCDLDALATSAAALHAVLNPDEVARASQFKFEPLRRRFLAAHGVRRVLLGQALKREPEDLRFATSPHGKPRVAGDLVFNVADSDSVFAMAIADSGALGIDVECLRSVPDDRELVSRYFSAEEALAFSRLERNERERAFFRGWTRKEALLKAVGEGLAIPLESFTVSLAEVAGDALIAAYGHRARELEAWSIRSISLCASVEAAVAWDRPAFECRVRDVTATICAWGTAGARHGARKRAALD